MSIFISYRRSDADIVGRMHDALARSFGAKAVYQDVEDLGAGRRFRPQLERAIETARAVIAVIGRDWVQERLRDPDDVLRQELEAALRQGVPIVPVTLNSITLPDPRLLPSALRPVLDYQAFVVRSGAEFGSTMDRLVDGLRPLLGMRASADRPSGEAEDLTAPEWYTKARTHAGLGERSEALDCLTHAIERDPGFAEAHSFRGTILLLEGRRAEAMVAFKSALAINPNDGDAQVMLASSLLATGDARQAKWWLEKTLDIERPPAQEGMVRSTYADVLIALGRVDEAVAQLDRSIALMGREAPPDVVGQAHRRKGDALAKAGRPEEAVNAYEAAIECAGPDTDVCNALGLAQLQIGLPEAARDTFLTAIALAPDSAGLAFNLACACSGLRDADAAFDALQRAIERDPDLKSAARSDPDLAWLRETGAGRFAELVG